MVLALRRRGLAAAVRAGLLAAEPARRGFDVRREGRTAPRGLVALFGSPAVPVGRDPAHPVAKRRGTRRGSTDSATRIASTQTIALAVPAVAIEEVRAPRTARRRSAMSTATTMIFMACSRSIAGECRASARPMPNSHDRRTSTLRRAGSARARCRRSRRSPRVARVRHRRALAAAAACTQKEALRAQFDAAARAAPSRSRAARRGRLDGAALSAGRSRPASTTRARQILIDNKVHDGRAGYHVVTPLVLADGRVVLVDRGWIAAGRVARDAAGRRRRRQGR